jgi:glycine dehydrogenase
LAKLLDKGLKKLGYTQLNETYFDTLKIDVGSSLEAIRQKTIAAKMNVRLINETTIGISIDETITLRDIETLVGIFAAAKTKVASVSEEAKKLELEWDKKFIRTSNFMLHPVFASVHALVRSKRSFVECIDDSPWIVHDEIKRHLRNDSGNIF